MVLLFQAISPLYWSPFAAFLKSIRKDKKILNFKPKFSNKNIQQAKPDM